MADTDKELEYKVTRDGFILGNWENHNRRLVLRESQAKAFLRDGSLELYTAPAKAEAPAKGAA